MKRQAYVPMNTAAVAMIHCLLNTAWELLGGEDSNMPDDDAQTAKNLIERALDFIADYKQVQP